MYQVYFDDIASGEDWGLITSSYRIGDAPPKENYIDKPGGDGSLDLTEALTGEVSYDDREFEAQFSFEMYREPYHKKLDQVRSFLNGRKRKIRVEDMQGYYLLGRCATSFESDGAVGIITVTATCEPWKYKNSVTSHNLVIGDKGVIDLKLSNSRKRVVPTITNSERITVRFNGRAYVIDEGSRRHTNIHLAEGYNDMRIIGDTGTEVVIEYQEGVI